MPLSRFLTISEKIVSSWSRYRNPDNVNHVVFGSKAELDLKTWTKAFHWVLQEAEVRKVDSTSFYARATGTNPKT
jgi:hypothetical protein